MQDIGKQFHIRCVEGDVGRYVFLPATRGAANQSLLTLSILSMWA